MLYLNEAFHFSCPSQAHWKLRAKSKCIPARNYTCLFDVTYQVNVYRDRCNRPRILAPGISFIAPIYLEKSIYICRTNFCNT